MGLLLPEPSPEGCGTGRNRLKIGSGSAPVPARLGPLIGDGNRPDSAAAGFVTAGRGMVATDDSSHGVRERLQEASQGLTMEDEFLPQLSLHANLLIVRTGRILQHVRGEVR